MIITELQYEESLIQQRLREYKQLYDQVEPVIRQLTESLAQWQAPLTALESEIKQMILLGGVSVKSPFAVATYVRESIRVKWDSRKLDGYMVGNPEIGKFRSESKTKAYVRLKVK